MSIIVGSSLSLPAVKTYTGLVTSVKNWLNRSDLDTLIPDFISLAEERINRALRVRQMEVSLAETAIASGTITVPDGTVGVKSLWLTGYEASPLRSQTFDFVKSRGTAGIASCFALQGSSLYFDGSGSVNGILYQRVPSLTETSDTNWLLSEAPSAYLSGALREAYDYIRNDSERDRWATRFEGVLSDLSGTDMRDRFSSPLQVRVR